MSDQIDKLRGWAEEQLAALKRQREGIDRKMAEFQGFLSILDQSQNTVSFNATVLVVPKGNGETTMPERIASILREAGKPMKASDVAEAIERTGFKYEGRVPLKILVSTELARQSKRRAHGIRKVSVGLYTAA